MKREIPLFISWFFVSSVGYSQSSGLVQPLVSPMPVPGSTAPASAPVSASPGAGGGNASPAATGSNVPPSAAPGSTAPAPIPGAAISAPAGSPGALVAPSGAGAGIPSGGGSQGAAALHPSNPAGGTLGNDLQGPSANQAGDSAELDKWIDGLSASTLPLSQRVAFVVDLPPKGIPQFLIFDAKKFNSLGFFQTANAAAVAWDLKLNKKSFSTRDSFDVATSLTKANMIIHAPKVGDWSVYLVKGDRKKPIARGAPPPGTKEEDLAGWLTLILGWDGVVLDQRGHQLLVGSTAKILSQPQLQALAVEGSSTKIGLNQNERKGSGLLSLVHSKGGIGVFDIVFLGQGVKEIPVGTKLVIEKK